MAGSAAWILSLTSDLTFIADEWDLLLLRQGWGLSQIMDPFNEHPVMLPALAFKLFQEVFGMESARPQQLLATATFLAMNAVLFAYLKRRVGDWAALIGVVLVLFLGAAFEDLLWAFQIGYFGSLATGIGALLALDRDDRRGDIVASVLLVASIAFSSMGIVFVAAAGVEWMLNPRDRARRLVVPGAAALFYAAWWIGWGHTAESSLDPGRIAEVPGFMFDALAAGFTSLAGLATGDGSEADQPNLVWGRVMAVIAVGLAIGRIQRLGRVPHAFLITAAAAFTFYFLSGMNQNDLRLPTSSRYQLPSAVFILLMAASLLEGIRIRPPALITAAAVSAVAVFGGIGLMNQQAEDRWQPASEYVRATLTGIELAGPGTVPGYSFSPSSFNVPADDYLAAVEAHGSPAFTESELADQEPSLKLTADASLFSVAGVELSGTPPDTEGASCRTVPVSDALELRGGTFAIENAGASELAVNLARVADPPGTLIGSVLPNATAGLRLPQGASETPWVLSFAGEGPVAVCRSGP
jgi:hypothetical protein